MRTVRRTAAVLILPAILYLGAACERMAPTGSVPVRGLEVDLVAQTASYLTQRLLALEALIPDGTLTPDDPLPFGHTIHVVTHDNQDSWKVQVSPTGEVTFDDERTCDPSAPPPLPPGALHLVVMPTTGTEPFTFARLRATRYHRTYLRDLTRLDYWACDEENNRQQWPFIALEIDWDGNNTIDEELVFEPTYQNPLDGGLCGAGSNQAKPMLQEWQFWDALRNDAGKFMACWWSMNDPLFPPGDVIRSLSEYIAAHPNAAIVNLDGNHGGVQIIHGFAENVTFDGWVDAFTIGKDINGSNGQTQNSTITYDFQKP